MYIAFDPGPDLGYAIFRNDGEFHASGIIRGLDEQPPKLQNLYLSQRGPHIVISEIWVAYNATAIMTSHAHDTILSEGMVRSYAILLGAEYVTQKSEILKIGEKWTGLKVAKGKAHKDSHDTSARIHGEYYLLSNGIKKHKK